MSVERVYSGEHVVGGEGMSGRSNDDKQPPVPQTTLTTKTATTANTSTAGKHRVPNEWIHQLLLVPVRSRKIG